MIGNKGQQIVNTNYWESEYARQGLFYLSWNAGAGRLLIPDDQKSIIREMKTAKMVIVSRGEWQGKDALELLFEDHSDNPFVINLVTEQTDRLIPKEQQGGGFVVTVWTKGGQKARFPGKYRVVNTLPYLKGWGEV